MRRRWALYFLVWTLVALLVAAQTMLGFREEEQGLRWTAQVGFQVAYWNGWALVTPFAFRLARLPMDRGRRARSIALHLVATAGVCVALLAWWAWLTIRFELYGPEFARLGFGPVFAHFFTVGFHYDLVTYGAILGIGFAVDSRARLRERELRAVRLEARLMEAQLEALRLQLQPHFLFNTLHAIASLVEEDPGGARRMIARLGDLLRLTLERGGRAEVTLREELEIVDATLEIEVVRFSERLRVVRAVDAETLEALVPSLVLQPLVENAVRHGVARRTGPGAISILARRAGGELILTVTDDGPGLAEGARAGIGLENTRARLAQLHGARARLELENVPGGGVAARIRLPWRTEYGGAS